MTKRLLRAINELRIALGLKPNNPLFRENLDCLEQRRPGCVLTP